MISLEAKLMFWVSAFVMVCFMFVQLWEFALLFTIIFSILFTYWVDDLARHNVQVKDEGFKG